MSHLNKESELKENNTYLFSPLYDDSNNSETNVPSIFKNDLMPFSYNRVLFADVLCK